MHASARTDSNPVARSGLAIALGTNGFSGGGGSVQNDAGTGVNGSDGGNGNSTAHINGSSGLSSSIDPGAGDARERSNGAHRRGDEDEDDEDGEGGGDGDGGGGGASSSPSAGFIEVWEGTGVSREEFVRLTLQSLRDAGYSHAAQALEAESGYALEHPSISAFRSAVLAGDWKAAERLLVDGLRSVAVSMGVPVESVMRGEGSKSLEAVKFLIQQQRYLELLEARQTKKALSVLRDELTPLQFGSERVHLLSSLIMCASPEEIKAKAKWDGAKGESRRRLLKDVEDAISPSVLLPSRRLPTLLHQAQTYQAHQCVYHNLPSSAFISLYNDHRCDRSRFPTETKQVLTGHDDEVWDIEYSHDGRRLASCGKDMHILIYRTGPGEYELERKLGPCPYAVGCVAWSPDDRYLLSSAEEEIRMWDVQTGRVVLECKEHEFEIGSVAWLPDGSGFVSGGMDRKLIFWTLSGDVTHTWDTDPYRIEAFAVAPNGKHIVAAGFQIVPSNMPGHGRRQSSDGSNGGAAAATTGTAPGSSFFSHQVHSTGSATASPVSSILLGGSGVGGPSPPSNVAAPGARNVASTSGATVAGRTSEMVLKRLFFYDVEKKKELGAIDMPERMTNVTISDDSKQALINNVPNEVHLWNIEEQTLVRRYTGQRQHRQIIRSCFGGAIKSFVASGSEDGKVYIWHRHSGQLLEALSGDRHGCVNAVSWSPTDPGAFASASDDHTVRIWGPPAASMAAGSASSATGSSMVDYYEESQEGGATDMAIEEADGAGGALVL